VVKPFLTEKVGSSNNTLTFLKKNEKIVFCLPTLTMSLLILKELVAIEEEVKTSIETYFDEIYLVFQRYIQESLINKYRKIDPCRDQISLLVKTQDAVNAALDEHPKFQTINFYKYRISPPFMDLVSHALSVRLTQNDFESIINACCDRFVSEMSHHEDAIPVFTCDDYKDIPCTCPSFLNSPCDGVNCGHLYPGSICYDCYRLCDRRKGKRKLEKHKHPLLVFPLVPSIVSTG
jgi:hypothetical protein